MEVMHNSQAVDQPKRVYVDNSQGSTSISLAKGEPVAYSLLSKKTLNCVNKLSSTTANNILFAGIVREAVTIPAYSTVQIEIDEPGSITEALVSDAGTNGVAAGSTLKWQYVATTSVMVEASALGKGAAILLDALTYASGDLKQLKKVYLDTGSFVASA